MIHLTIQISVNILLLFLKKNSTNNKNKQLKHLSQIYSNKLISYQLLTKVTIDTVSMQ